MLLWDHFLGGNTAQIPTGFRNYYPDIPSSGNFGTLVSNTASDWQGADLIAHTHDAIEVTYDQGSLKPRSSLNAVVNIPSTTVLDNASNVAALQIDMKWHMNFLWKETQKVLNNMGI